MQCGYTALHFGVENNHGSLVELLLEHNAGVNIKAKVARGLRDNACVASAYGNVAFVSQFLRVIA